MNRLVTCLCALSLLAAACGGGDDAADADGDAAPASTSSTAPDPTTTVAPSTTTTEAAPTTTTTTAPTTSTTTTPTTTSSTTPAALSDTTAPEVPAGLVCSAGGGSGELTLEWDAPADPTDVETIQIYMSEDGGSFVRLHTYTQDQLLSAEPTGWRANVFPVAFATPIELAVTYDDAAGNESGWDPIDAWSPFAGAGCNSGAPAAPTVVSATRGAGSGEVRLTVEIDADDILDWTVEIDQGAGWVFMAQYRVDTSVPDQFGIDIGSVDWTLPVTYRVVASDHHGNISPASFRECPIPISPGDVAC